MTMPVHLLEVPADQGSTLEGLRQGSDPAWYFLRSAGDVSTPMSKPGGRRVFQTRRKNNKQNIVSLQGGTS
jgi:hypothetical protein